MKTQAKHPYAVWTDYQPWPVRDIPLPQPTGVATYTEADAKAYAAQWQEFHRYAAVLSGGGGPGAFLCIVHSVDPVPMYHAGQGRYMADKDKWGIRATVELLEADDEGSHVRTPWLWSWRLRLYLGADGEPVYGRDFRKSLEADQD